MEVRQRQPAPVSLSPESQANADEAQRAIELGMQHFQGKNYQKAVKFFTIAQRLHPTQETHERLKKAVEALGPSYRDQRASAGPSAAPAPTASQDAFARSERRPQSPSSSSGSGETDNRRERERGRGFYIEPWARKPLLFISVIIIALGIWRFYLKGKPFTLGALPGDINYQSSNFIVSFPWVSCMFFSLVANLILRIFNQPSQQSA